MLATHGEAVDQPTRILVTSSLALAEAAAAEAERLQDEILRRIAGRPEFAWLWSLPGIGPWVAVVIGAILGDLHRFRTARQVTRSAGLDSAVHQSGEADWRGHISRQGPALIRQVLVEAAWWAVRGADGQWSALFERLAARIGKRRAVVAVARNLFIAAWWVWWEQQLAVEVDRLRYQKKLSGIRTMRGTLAPYPLAERWGYWPGTRLEAPASAVSA
ncbi:MAG: transposase [Actinomycetia bacterium]|nr:transposase [Actinomycetes bacterium]